MQIVIQHPTGNANVRAAADGFLKAGLMGSFHTTVATFSGSLLDRIGAFGPFSELRRRRFTPELKTMTRVHPWREAGRMVAAKTGFTGLIRHEQGPFCVDAVYRSLDRKVAAHLKACKTEIDAVYAYEDGAAASFETAKNFGLQCLYDLPIGYWRAARKLLANEKERRPDWTATLTGFDDSDEKLANKDKELQLADRIFVASRFTANTLKEFPGSLAPVEVIPYGFPSVYQNRTYESFAKRRPLKLLFVGGLSQRKGIADLFAAVEPVKQHVSLTVVGLKATNQCNALNSALSKHQWIPSLPHSEILRLMRAHDVLVFPSLFEGFGLVITEAMSQGTPVITTDRTAGPDLIQHGENGWLVKAASAEALFSSIEALLLQPEQIKIAGRQAMETARKRPWEVYGQELATAVLNHFKRQPEKIRA